MAYRHKLSCRLALLRDLFGSLVCAVAVATCEPPTGPATGLTSHLTQIVVVPETLTVDPAQLTKFVPYGRSATGDTAGVAVTWTASGGTITLDGTYTPDTVAGDFVVTATSAQLSLSGASRVHNRGRRSVASVSVAPAPASVLVGQTVQLSATPKDAAGNALSGRIVTWGSSNTTTATVSSGGLVTGMGAGSATITATSETKAGTSGVTVTLAAVAAVSVSPSPASVSVGQTVQLTATLSDAGGNVLSGRVVTWGTNNASIATVSGTGLVTAVAPGAATISD